MALYTEGGTTASNNDKARYGLQQITQKLANHKNQLADTQLKSTIDGYVQTKLHEAGETVLAGMPVVSLFGGGGTEVEIKISVSDYADLEKYKNFSCRFDVTGDVSYPLTIARVSQEANSSQLYTVRLKFKSPIDHKRITPGMTTMVYVETAGEEAGIVMVPASAVFRTNGKTQVFVYEDNSKTVKARSVHVQMIRHDGMIQIDSGLQSGENVVSAGVHHLSDGQQVELLERPSASNVGGLL
jgi:RND family efflux transporter MFP subunit